MRHVWRAVLLVAACLTGVAEAEPRHGLSVFGELKYPSDFRHFDWTNPDAPKGGLLRVRDLGTFDSVNMFVLKGRRPNWILTQEVRLHDTLMVRSYDEPDAHYALVATSAELSDDRRHVTFRLDRRARFHDGSPISADDVVWSLEAIRTKGHPILAQIFEPASAVALDAGTVRFDLADGASRDLPVRIAGALPILSKRYYQDRDFAESTLEPPLASGPYRIAEVRSGQSITLERVGDYWARDLPVNVGQWNFDRIRIDYYADRTAALLGFFADAYDFREEFTSKSWATEYDDKPAVKDGRIVRLTTPDGSPSGVQGWFYNLRRTQFADRRVRDALDLAFDFEWTNRNLFYGLYRRAASAFQNSDLAQEGPPSPAELALLEPLRDQVPPEVFGPAFRSPETDGSGNNRRNLRRATDLLAEAGWTIREGKLRDSAGTVFTIEFLMYEPTFERIVGPYVKNLERLGIEATMRFVDPAQFVERVKVYDFDTVTARFSPPETPGAEMWSYWGSRQGQGPGSNNYAGVADPAVDALIARVLEAPDRDAMRAATRALDRVIMWNRYIVPQWYKGEHNLAFWDRFGRPATKPPYHRGVVNSWWFDRARAARTGGNNAG
ncbi:MAG: extracellular solute-binding protein [Pseudomonadota bacterium]|nr:extracellular solute-binding protein [Pseudomonadota bacterium]